MVKYNDFVKLTVKTKIILIIQSLSMLGGGINHLIWLLQNGFLSENYNASLFTTIFWDTLMFFDISAALLLFIKPKGGIILTAFIILFDVMHNNIVYFDILYMQPHLLSEWISNYWTILCQIVFCIFVFATLKSNLKAVKRINY